MILVKRVFYILLVILYSCFPGYAQNEAVTDIIPPSPTASSLAKFSEIPVSYYTGIPNISIPLWTIKAGELELPISLSYHASGIKVNENPGWVGAGWALNAGGVITRTVHGKIDDGYNGFLEYKELLSLGYFKEDRDCELLSSMAAGRIDTKPDIFLYNFVGHSGKFLYKNKGLGFTVQPQKKIQIFTEYGIDYAGESDIIEKFEIIDPSGKIYNFGGASATEKTKTDAKYSQRMTYNSSWYLTQISSYNKNDNIYFQYSNDGTVNQYAESQRTECVSMMNGAKWNCNSIESMVTKNTIETVKLDNIIWENGEIEFVKIPRGDDTQGSRLDKIVIRKNGKIVKKFDFSYKVFSGRLYLFAVTEIGSKGNRKNPYIFKYKKPDKLPNNETTGLYCVDHWGYYNGNKDQLSLIPNINYSASLNFTSGDRNTDPQKCLYGILEKIIYPSKGYEEFIFGANKVFGSKILVKGIVEEGDEIIDLEEDGEGDIDSLIFSTTPLTIGEPDFEIVAEAIINLPRQNGQENYQDAGYRPELYNYKATIRDLNNGNTRTFTPQDNSSITSYSLDLIPGHNYKMKIERTSTADEFASFKVSWVAKTKEIGDTIYRNRHVGGARIERIKKFDFNGKPIYQRKFDYNMFSSDKSSGHLFSKPRYYKEIIKASQGQGGINLQNEIQISSSSNIPLGSQAGSHVGYEKVTEYYTDTIPGNNYTNGKVEYTFAHSNDFFGSNPIGNSSFRGQLLNKTIYSYFSEEDRYNRVKEIINKYNILESTKNVTKGIDVQYNIYNYACGWSTPSDFIYDQEPYTIRSGLKYPESRIVRYYNTPIDDISDPVLESSTIYKYNTHNLKVREIATVKSNGDTIVEKYKYPYDFISVEALDDYTACKNSLMNSESNCRDDYFSCNIDYRKCNNEYQKCYGEWVACVNNAYGDVNNFMGSYVSGSLDISDCNSVYDGCTDGISCNQGCLGAYTSCLEQTYNSTNCFGLFYMDLYDQYKHADSALKPIIGLYLFNNINKEIEKQKILKKKNGEKLLIDSELTLFKVDEQKIYPSKILRNDLTQPLTHFSGISANYNRLIIPDYYQEKIWFDSYNSEGQIQEYHEDRNIPVSLIWDRKLDKPLASINNAHHNEILYTSCENSDGWHFSDSLNFIANSNLAVTGKGYLELLKGVQFYSTKNLNLNDNSKYILTFWAKGTGELNINSTNHININNQKWRFYKVECQPSLDRIEFQKTSGENIYLDEIRFYPSNAEMTTYNYNHFDQMITKTDPNDITTYYGFDGFGRLTSVLDNNRHILKKIDYHYLGNLDFDYKANRLNVDFSVLTSPPSDDATYTYKWDFGDGNVQETTIDTIKHTYWQPGSYLVSLSLLRNGKKFTSSLHEIDITADLPGQPNLKCPEGLEYDRVYDVCYSDDYNSLTMDVDYDKNGATHFVFYYKKASETDWNSKKMINRGSTFELFDFGEIIPGTLYDIKVKATNNENSSSFSRIGGFMTADKVPDANFNFKQVEEKRIRFYNTTNTHYDNSALSTKWYFGDGNSSNSENPTHTYSDYGTYKVRLEVENDGGNDSKERNVIVSDNSGEAMEMELRRISEDNCQYQEFEVSVDGGTLPYKIEWFLGNELVKEQEVSTTQGTCIRRYNKCFDEFNPDIMLKCRVTDGAHLGIIKSETIQIRKLDNDNCDCP